MGGPAYRDSPGIDCRTGNVRGLAIHAGERVMVWGGHVFTTADVVAGRVAPGRTVYIGEDVFSGALPGHYDRQRDDRGDFINHSCDPNIWMRNENTLVARRNIASGEELTVDYAMFEGDESDVRPWVCHCDSSLCRHRITGKDWRMPELQQRYEGHFSPFINERIRRLKASRP
jgi:uncharacterized protein